MFGLFKKPATTEQLEFALITTTGIHLKTFGVMPNGEEILNNVQKVLSEVGCKLSHDQVSSIRAASSLIALSSELTEKFKAMISAGVNTDGKIYAEIVMTMRRSGVGI
jgi:hypothetical protein